MENLNILIDLRPLMAGNTSGVEIYIQNLLTEILKNEKQNHYILWWNSHRDVSQNIPHFSNKNITYIATKIPNKILNLSLSLLRYPKIDKWIGKKINQKIDAVFMPDPRPAPVSQDCRKIITIHDLSFEHYKKTFSYKTQLWHKILRPKKEAHEADQIIAVSQATKWDLSETYQIPANKIKVIYEASNLQTPNSRPQTIQNKYNLPEKFLLTLSTIEPRKNIDGLLEAFQKLKKETNLPHKLVIAGKTNESIFAKIKALPENSAEILFTGFIAEEDKGALYQLATAFVYPSFFEGFGLPLLEAMQVGCPVITSDLSAMPEVVENAAELVNPYDIESIKNGIKKVLEDQNLQAEMKQKGLRRAKKFSWKKCAKETISLITN